MKLTVIFSTIIAVIGLMVSVYFYTENTRYEVVTTGRVIAYKIDKKTGQVWVVASSESERELREFKVIKSK